MIYTIDISRREVFEAAVEELAELVNRYLGGSRQIFFIDRSNKEVYID